jgi:hypothetical protein
MSSNCNYLIKIQTFLSGRLLDNLLEGVRSKPDTIGGKELVLELNPMKTKGEGSIRARPSSARHPS